MAKYKIRITFNEIRTKVENINAQTLMKKAVLYNCFAKRTDPRSRDSAYRGKNRMLKQLIEKCSASVEILDHQLFAHKAGAILIRLKGNQRGLCTHPDWLQASA